jgi:signal peptidase I
MDYNINKEKQSAENKQKENSPSETVLICLHDLVHLLAGILLVLLLLFRIVIVSGPSMNATLIDGDTLLLLSNIFYTDPKPGDIIVASKESFKNGEPIIKRVIATEGQEVDIDFTAGIVYVDGVPLEEDYTLTPTNLEEGNRFPMVVDDGCIFVMGDNRNMSKDSRNPEIGLIDRREVLGKAMFLLLPGTEGGTQKPQYDRIGVVS